MAYNFPNSPSNGDTVVVNGVTYEYNSTDNAWKTGTGVGPAITSDGSTPSLASGITAAEIRTLIGSPDLSSVDTDIIPDGDGTRDLGSSTAKWKDLYLSGNTLFLGPHSITADSSAIIFPEIKIGTGSNQVTLSGGAGGTLQTGGTSVFSGAFADLTGKPTTIAGYGITDGATQSYVTTQINNVIDSAPGALDTLNELAAALGDDANFSTTVTNNLALKAPLASPSLTGTPTAPTPTIGNNTTQIATTAFVQSAISGAGSYNDASVDTHLNRTTAATGEVLSWNGSDYDWVARTTFSTLSGKPTTLAGYGITDGATIDSPAFTGTPTAPTASGGTNSTQIATTAYVQGEISSFSGGDSQANFTASGAITEGKAVILSSSAGQVEEVSQVAVAGAHATAVSSSNSTVYRTQAVPLDYNDQDSVYQQFWYDGSSLIGSVWSTNLGTLTLSPGTGQALLGGVTPDNYFHIKGTSTGILRAGTNSYIVTNSSGTLSIGSANAVGAYSKIVTTESGDLIALNGSDCYFVTVSGNTISFGSAIAIGLTPAYQAFEWSPTYNKLVAASISSGTITYTTGTVSGSNITWASVSTESSWGSTSTDIAFHVGVERLIGFRRHYVGQSSPTTVKFRSSSFNGSAFAFSSSTETIVLGPSNTNPNASYYYLSPYIKCSKTDGGFGIFTKYEYNTTDRYLGNLTSGGVFSLEVGGTRIVYRETGTTLSYRPGGENDPVGYLSMGVSSGQTSPSNNSSAHSIFFRTSSVSTKDSYLGIAQSTVASGASVTVMLAGGISTRHTSLTPDTTMYVQDNGTISSTVSTVIAGKALNATSIQVADGRGTFDKAVAFSTITGKPTTLSGYGITDGASTLSNIDIGSNDFITTGKSYFANMFATTGDLPSATTYHGMFAHVHGTGAGYFAHAGNWVELANKSYVDTEVANLVNSAPATLDTLDELAAALNDDANFATTVTTSLGLKAPLASPALTGTPTAPTASSGTNSTQIATTAFVAAAISGLGGGGGASVTTSDSAPSSPSAGDLWYNTDAGGLFLYYTDADSSQWVEVVGKTGPAGPTGAAGTAAISRYANVAGFPASPTAADLAYANDTNTVYLYNGTAWEVVSSGNNETPVILTEPPTTTQALNPDGTTSTVTMTAQDPEGFDITYGIAYKTAGNTLPSQLASATTIDQSTGVYTFTPSTTTSGSFTARLSASDGARITTRLVNFDLTFLALVDYLVVGGGGSGGQRHGGGGGAGGLIYSTNQSISRGVTIPITIGAGGTHPTGTGSVNGGNGGNTVFGSFATAIGGGGGGTATAGADGGSGGGGGYNGGTAGSGTSGQGNDGGAGASGSPYHGGGGGGAGAAGSAAGSDGGNGGNGLEINITGTPTYYAGGGGGGDYYATSGNPGSGGLGGGGAGASGVATNGTDGLGGGGGGSGGTGGVGADGTPGDGGSGVVIIRTLATASATTGSPSLTTDGSYNIYTFTADGSITF